MTDGKLPKDLIPAQQTPFWHSLRLVPYTHVGHIYIYDCVYVVYIRIYLKFFLLSTSDSISKNSGQVQKY